MFVLQQVLKLQNHPCLSQFLQGKGFVLLFWTNSTAVALPVIPEHLSEMCKKKCKSFLLAEFAASLMFKGRILNWSNVTCSMHFSAGVIFESLHAADFMPKKCFIREFF